MDITWERNAAKWRHRIFAVVVIITLAILMVIFRSETTRAWIGYQESYNTKLAAKLNRAELANTPININQIWLPQLNNAIDRCTTCHLGLENPLFANEPQPLTAHPGDYLRTHPMDKFGCTVCHQGDGQAITVDGTHGAVPHLNRQLLVKEFVQSSCVKCHVDLYDLSVTAVQFPLAATFFKGRDLTYEKGCRVCHKINDEGGTMGPELTGFGSRTELAFWLIHDFEHVEGPPKKAQWEYEHFLDPQKITPGNPVLNIPPTIMPNFGFTPEEARALTVFVLGLRNPKADAIPYEYIAKKKLAQAPPKPSKK